MVILTLLGALGHHSKMQNSHNSDPVYCGSCPFCPGGTDRFIVWPHSPSKRCKGRFWCRRCEKSGDTIDVYMKLKGIVDVDLGKRLFYEEYKEAPQDTFKESYRSKALIGPTDLWREKLGGLVDMAHNAIGKQEDLLKKLEKRGLPLEAVKTYKIGYLQMKTTFNAQSLGYEEEKKDIHVFPGIVIPTFEPSGKLIRIKVRRTDWRPEDRLGKYLAVTGSMGGLNLIGNRKAPHVVVVESELDAYAVAHAAKDKALVIAVGSNTKNPDLATDFLVKKKDRLIVIYDNDKGGDAMLTKWKGLYSKALGAPSPQGKDIGEAFEQGYDIRKWLKGLLS